MFANVVKHGFNTSQYNWKRTVNSWKIDMGMFKGDFWQVVNKFTYGGLNSLIGATTAHLFNTVGMVDGVTDLNGMLALSGVTSGGKAFTIGHYSMGPGNYVADWRDHLFVHEYGHYIQSQRWGSLYIPVIGTTSLYSAAFTSRWSKMSHSERWFEQNASKLGAKYFDKHYGSQVNGYRKGDPNYFDYDAFINRRQPKYLNPRTISNPNFNGLQDKSFPTGGSKIVIWDFIF